MKQKNFKIFPVSYLEIIEHFQRRSNVKNSCVGVLMGEKKSNNVYIKHSIGIPDSKIDISNFKPTNENENDENNSSIFDFSFIMKMIALHKQVYHNEIPVGWYLMGKKNEKFQFLFHKQYLLNIHILFKKNFNNFNEEEEEDKKNENENENENDNENEKDNNDEDIEETENEPESEIPVKKTKKNKKLTQNELKIEEILPEEEKKKLLAKEKPIFLYIEPKPKNHQGFLLKFKNKSQNNSHDTSITPNEINPNNCEWIPTKVDFETSKYEKIAFSQILLNDSVKKVEEKENGEEIVSYFHSNFQRTQSQKDTHDKFKFYSKKLKNNFDVIQKYVKDVIDGKIEGDPKVGRYLLNIFKGSHMLFVSRDVFQKKFCQTKADIDTIKYLVNLTKTNLNISENIMGNDFKQQKQGYNKKQK